MIKKHLKNRMKICKIANCTNKIHARDWCKKHYLRNWKYGTPQLTKTREDNLSDAQLLLWMESAPQIQVDPETGCQEWQGAKNNHGYGMVSHKGKIRLAHRLRWFLTWGYMPKKFLLHSCDTPACTNLEHLREGSQQDNIDDMIVRGRQAVGEDHGNSKLNEEKIIAIRELRRNTNCTYQELAAMFGVKKATISAICTRRTWKHIN